MDAQGLNKLIIRYDRLLASKGIKPKACNPKTPVSDQRKMLKHSRFMLIQVSEMVREDRLLQAHVEIGRIQGILWVHGVLGIDQLCEHMND